MASGLNPTQEKRRERSERSFEVLGSKYLEYLRRGKKSVADSERMLTAYILPSWRHRRFDMLTRTDVVQLLDAMVARGVPVMANRTQSLISGIFSWALDSGLIESHPCPRA